MINSSKIFYSSTTVDYHSFIDLVSVFKPEHLTNNYYEYCKILKDEYQTNEDIVNIVELVRNIEVDDGVLQIDSYNSISAVICNSGLVKYVACY